ncbi:MAG TPA: substrate-binding protein [Actinomycetota bacterium]|nr:substrate-binding protein [Actinomycetota bacterium]
MDEKRSADGRRGTVSLSDAMWSRREFLKKTGLGLTALTVGNSLLAACAPGEEQPAGRGGEPFKLGALIPLTGIETHVGESMRVSTQIAVEEVNANGGVLGRQIQLIVEDEASDPAIAVQKARKLIREDGVSFIVGTLISAVRNAVVEVTGPENVPLFNPTYYEGGLCDTYFFSTGALPNQQIDPFVPWMIQNVGKSFYLIGSDYVWPRGSYYHLKEGVKQAGGSILGEEYVPFGKTDFSAEIRRILEANPDVLYPLIAGVDGITFWKQLAGFPFKGARVSHSVSEAIIQGLDAETARGIISAAPYFMVVDNPANQAFVRKYQQRSKAPYVDTFGEGLYDAVHLFALGAERAGSLETERLVQGLKGVAFDSPQGRITIDPATQHTSHAFHVAEATGNEWNSFRILHTENEIAPAADCGEIPGLTDQQ